MGSNLYKHSKPTKLKKHTIIVISIIVLVLLLDQSLKVWIKTNMFINESFSLLGIDWARIHFIENKGAAFGLELGGSYGKLILSLFRIVAVTFLSFYLRYLIKSKANLGLLISFGLILAGAIGNIIDSAFYGMIFSESGYTSSQVAELFPEAGGYAKFLHGKVVDMFYFPMFQGVMPSWMPFWAGEPYIFFRPVFNIADAAITIGVLSILIFQRSFFADPEENNSLETTDGTTVSQPLEFTDEHQSDIPNDLNTEKEQ